MVFEVDGRRMASVGFWIYVLLDRFCLINFLVVHWILRWFVLFEFTYYFYMVVIVLQDSSGYEMFDC